MPESCHNVSLSNTLVYDYLYDYHVYTCETNTISINLCFVFSGVYKIKLYLLYTCQCKHVSKLTLAFTSEYSCGTASQSCQHSYFQYTIDWNTTISPYSCLPEQVHVVLPATHIPCWWIPELSEPALAPDGYSRDQDSRQASGLWKIGYNSLFCFNISVFRNTSQFPQMKLYVYILHALVLSSECIIFALGRYQILFPFSPCEPCLVVYRTLADVWHYLPDPATLDNSLEGSSRRW